MKALLFPWVVARLRRCRGKLRLLIRLMLRRTQVRARCRFPKSCSTCQDRCSEVSGSNTVDVRVGAKRTSDFRSAVGLTGGLVVLVLGISSHAQQAFYLLEKGDEKMASAMRAARSSLDHFLAVVRERSQQYDAYGAYIKVEEDGETEYLWLSDVQPYDEEYLMGVVISEPGLVTRYQYGQTIGFLPADVYDWQLKDSTTGIIAGAYTICAMSDLTRAEDRAFLEEHKFACTQMKRDP